MSRPGRRLASGCLGLVAFMLVSAPSYAGSGLQRCLDKAIDHNGEPPTCTKVNGTWVASWPDDGTGSGSGFAGVIGFLAVLAIVGGIGITIWKVSTARSLARESGMNPGVATGMTLLTDDGLAATYLAANLRGSTAKPAPAPDLASTSPSATSRLEELKGLLDRGLVTQDEYDARRQAIIDSV